MRHRIVLLVAATAAFGLSVFAQDAGQAPAGRRGGAAPAAQGGGGRGQGTAAPLPPGQNPNGMHIYIRAGLKSHGPGQHDYPQLLADWSKLLTEHGAVVDGSLHSPTAEELAKTDVVVMY